MTQQPAETVETPPTEGHDAAGQQESVRDSFARFYADGRVYVQAEVEKQKLRAGIIGTAVRDALICAMVALMLLFASIVALLIGLIIAFAPMIGALWSTFAVLGGALIIAVALLLLAKARIGRMSRAIKP